MSPILEVVVACLGILGLGLVLGTVLAVIIIPKRYWR